MPKGGYKAQKDKQKQRSRCIPSICTIPVVVAGKRIISHAVLAAVPTASGRKRRGETPSFVKRPCRGGEHVLGVSSHPADRLQASLDRRACCSRPAQAIIGRLPGDRLALAAKRVAVVGGNDDLLGSLLL